MIYADNAATTKLDPEALELIYSILKDHYANPSQSYSMSRPLKSIINNSRELIANCIGASKDEIFFTSGGTESDNWSLRGVAEATNFNCTIISSTIEHHAILNTCNALRAVGCTVRFLPVTEKGVVCVNHLTDLIDPSVKIITCMHCNNETGILQPLDKLAAIAHNNNIYVHTDAVQTVGHIPLQVNDLGIDLLSASAHKFNGPKGIGFLYIKKGTAIHSYLTGGRQEFAMRAGTENVAFIAAMARALANNINNLTNNIDHVIKIENAFLESLKKSGATFRINGSGSKIPGIINISLPGISGESLLHRLDLRGICVSTGAACNGSSIDISHVLKAMNVQEPFLHGSIRVSFGKYNTVDEAKIIASELIKIINEVKMREN